MYNVYRPTYNFLCVESYKAENEGPVGVWFRHECSHLVSAVSALRPFKRGLYIQNDILF